MKDLIKLLLAGMLLCMSGLQLTGQTTIRLVDSQSNEPVPFAHVCFESLDKSVLQNKIADEKGVIIFDNDLPFQLAATSVGYATLIDTLKAGGTHTLYMVTSFTQMDEVVVTAQYSPRRVDQSIYNVGVIDNRKIREKGATNLSEALNNELGIRISNDAALGSSMSIQGLSGEHVKILIDGVPVIGRMNGNIDLSQINMYNVDHIEMVEGPMSVVYGSNALAGAVNIITKENTRGKFSSWINSYIESVGVYNFDVGAGGNFGKHAGSFSASRNFFSGFSEIDTTRSKQWKPRLQYNLDGYYKYQADRLGIKVDLRYFHETIENKGPLLPPYMEKAFDTYYYTRRWSDRIQADYRFSEGRGIDAVFAYSTYSRIKHTYFKDLTTLKEIMLSDESSNDTTTFTSYLLRGTFTDESLFEKLSYQVGTDINIEDGQGKRIQDGHQSIGDYAAFLSLQYEPSEKFSFQPGLRAGYNTNYKSPLVPSLNLRLDPRANGRHVFRASYARGFRAPSLKELYLYFVDINHNLRGNPDLKAEYSHNFNLTWDLSMARNANRFGIQAGLFYNSIHNRITLALDSATVYSYINVDQFRTAGGKINFKYSLHPRFTFELGIFQVARQSMIREGEGFTTPFRHSTDVSSNASYNWMSKKLRFLITYKYTGRQPQFYSDAGGDIREGFIEGYHMLDASANKSFWNERILLGIGAKNLFDYTNIESSGITTGSHSSGSGNYPVAWGRTFFVSLRLYFNKY
jgi:outer membrane receptor for ferrienterochelin and colicins